MMSNSDHVTPFNRLDEDFNEIFGKRVEADRQGHTGDLVPRNQSFEQTALIAPKDSVADFPDPLAPFSNIWG